MRLLDPKIRNNIFNYIFQCVLAAISVALLLTFFDVLTHTAIIASLGATTFIVFTMPNSYSSRIRPLLGGYFVGIIVGMLCFVISQSDLILSVISNCTTRHMVFGSIAVGFSIFIMVITNTEHPPASGIALGLVINQWDYRTILFISGGVLVLFGIKTLLKYFLIDLH